MFFSVLVSSLLIIIVAHSSLATKRSCPVGATDRHRTKAAFVFQITIYRSCFVWPKLLLLACAREQSIARPVYSEFFQVYSDWKPVYSDLRCFGSQFVQNDWDDHNWQPAQSIARPVYSELHPGLQTPERSILRMRDSAKNLIPMGRDDGQTLFPFAPIVGIILTVK